MEYNVPLTNDVSGVSTVSPRPLADTAHPYEPCSQVGDAYTLSCYHELPQWWVQVIPDKDSLGVLCEAITNEQDRQACFQGLGSTIPSSFAYDVDKTIAYCAHLLKGEGHSLCVLAASGAFSTSANDKVGAQKLCATIRPDEPYHCSP